MPTQLTSDEVAAGWWSVNCCDGKFRGFRTSHCTACHETFTSPSGFDLHRRNGTCLNPAEMTAGEESPRPVFQRANREYPCWSQPQR